MNQDDLFADSGAAAAVSGAVRRTYPAADGTAADGTASGGTAAGTEPATDRLPAVDEAPLLVARGLRRVFVTAAGERVANDGIDLTVAPGELVVLAGPSGAGKTTLLNLLAGLDRPTSGTVTLAGKDYAGLADRDLSELRREYIGYVFQSFGLLPMLSARENVEVPLRLLRTGSSERDSRVLEVMAEVGLAGHLDQRPHELSGGQQQRVSLARALVARPRLLLADEPTAQLDSATAGTILGLVGDLVHRHRVAAVVTTHDEALMGLADRIVHLHDGRITTPTGGRHAR